jgi:hypothetical protein
MENAPFPLTSAHFEADYELVGLGQTFRTELVALGRLQIASGKLVVADPILGMSSYDNPYIVTPKGTFAVYQTRVICLEREELEIPAYLSVIFDPQALEHRQKQQKHWHQDNDLMTLRPGQYSFLRLGEEGVWIDSEEHTHDDEFRLDSRSGMIGLVDADSLENRMPDPLFQSWFDEFFNPVSTHNWTAKVDDPDHLVEGCANINLPTGPDDWDETRVPTIVLMQMANSQTQPRLLIEWSLDEEGHRLHPMAFHIDLGFVPSVQQKLHWL